MAYKYTIYEIVEGSGSGDDAIARKEARQIMRQQTCLASCGLNLKIGWRRKWFEDLGDIEAESMAQLFDQVRMGQVVEPPGGVRYLRMADGFSQIMVGGFDPVENLSLL